jgi:hypothetical protein
MSSTFLLIDRAISSLDRSTSGIGKLTPYYDSESLKYIFVDDPPPLKGQMCRSTAMFPGYGSIVSTAPAGNSGY